MIIESLLSKIKITGFLVVFIAATFGFVGVASADIIYHGSYLSPGTFTSSVIDTGQGFNFTTLDYTASIPVNTTANVRPNQTNYFTVHRGDNSFDYTCSGTEEKRDGYCNPVTSISSSGFGYLGFPTKIWANNTGLACGESSTNFRAYTTMIRIFGCGSAGCVCDKGGWGYPVTHPDNNYWERSAYCAVGISSWSSTTKTCSCR